MSKLNEFISRYGERLTKANSLSDRTVVLRIIAEYGMSIEGAKDCSEDIKDGLNGMIDKAERPQLDLLLIAAAIHPRQIYVDSLCAILSHGNPELPNELIVDLLYKIPSPKSVPYLAKAILLTFADDSYNEFGVKCLDALAAINTDDAWVAIEASLQSSSVRIQELARKLVNARKLS